MRLARLVFILGMPGLLFSMVLCRPSEAGEVIIGLENRIAGDSNVFRSIEGGSRRIERDGIWEVTPSIQVRETQRELNYSLDYRPVFEAYFTQPGIDGWDHSQRSSLDWNISGKDQVGIVQSFRRARNVREFETGEFDSVNEFVLDESDRERITRSSVSAFFSRQWSPAAQFRLGVDFNDVEFNSARNLDSRSYSANASVNYVPVDRWTLGVAGVGRIRQTEGLQINDEDNDPLNPLSLLNDRGIARENAYIGNLVGTVAHKLTETIDLSLQVGPTLIWSKRFAQDVRLDPSFFAAAEVRKAWQKGSAQLTYTRSESGSAGDGSVIVDSVRLTLTVSPFRRLNLLGVLEYTTRDSFSFFTAGGQSLIESSQVDNYSAVTTIRYQLAENVILRANARYREFQRNGSQTDATTRVISGFVALQYRFDPWQF